MKKTFYTFIVYAMALQTVFWGLYILFSALEKMFEIPLQIIAYIVYLFALINLLSRIYGSYADNRLVHMVGFGIFLWATDIYNPLLSLYDWGGYFMNVIGVFLIVILTYMYHRYAERKLQGK